MNSEFKPENLAWIILLLPLLSAVLITLGARRDARLSAVLSISAVGISFVGSIGLYILVGAMEVGKAYSTAVTWLDIPGTQGLQIPLILLVDRLSLMMLLVVTGVGLLIHIYSAGYMREDPGRARYFGCLSLFMFSMLGIVLASNFVMMFIFWELVGVSSYLLIGFWHERPAAADAAKKAFLTNRVGDFGFLLGILLLWSASQGRIDFEALQAKVSVNPGVFGAMAGLAGLLIFCGAVGKSAQFPLHVWLPDAMEGPTPVSALIHAATMVAAGVYMLCRIFFIYLATPAWPASMAFLGNVTALDIIAWVGAITALLAALMAIQQNDIKRILAYSTLSQLGYMVMAVGLSKTAAGSTTAIFHLITHAFFKALLFLAAGSVILAVHHEQDIWKMGGLRQRMPATHWTLLIGTLALCGVPPLSGFYSKDAILALAWEHHRPLFVVGVATAALTAFYMFRLYFVALLGKARSDQAGHAHESKAVMVVPLVLLAVGSVVMGLVGVERYLVGGALEVTGWQTALLAPFHHAPTAAFAGLGAAAAGVLAAWALYGRAASDPLPGLLGPVAHAMAQRFYFDEIYAWLIRCTHEALSYVADWFDRWIVAGLLVKGAEGTSVLLGWGLRLLQTGHVQFYAFLFAAGLAVMLWWALR